MTTTQRVIKYLAIALAIFIIVSIASGILFGLNIFSDILGLTKEGNSGVVGTEIENSDKITTRFDNTQIARLKIELAYSSLTIKEGESFNVETNTRKVEAKQSGDELIVKERGTNLFGNNNQRTVIVTIPRDTVLHNVKIEAGAGQIEVEKLATKNLDLEIGAGKVTIQNLKVTQKAKIEGGAGKVEIKSGEITNLDLEMGVGSFAVSTSLAGNNKIEAGMGRLEVNLTNGLENYTIRASKGIGSIRIGDKEVSSNVEYGTGETNIKIDGGVGSIEVK